MSDALSDDAKDVLRRALDSYLCGYGLPLNELFEQIPGLEEAYNSFEDKSGTVAEASPKSTREKILRSVRHTIRHKRKNNPHHLRNPNMLDRVRPEKSANNDPRRGGNRIHNERPIEIQESLVFIRNNLSTTGQALREAIGSFGFPDTLRKLVKMLIATRLGGWRESGDYYVNEDGSVASKHNWDLMEDGHLKPHNRTKPVEYDISWLLEARQYCG